LVFVPPAAAGNNFSLRDLCGLLFKLKLDVSGMAPEE